MTKKKLTVILDWDGTLVENKWPAMGDWLPGAIEACKKLHAAGLKLVVFSARLSPYNPFTSEERPPGDVLAAIQQVRSMLDDAGLHFVDIWTVAGKPGGFVYVDDRAERYHGRPGSWKALTEKILMRAGLTTPEFPEFDQAIAMGDANPEGQEVARASMDGER